jgi:hypothetical protein
MTITAQPAVTASGGTGACRVSRLPEPAQGLRRAGPAAGYCEQEMSGRSRPPA